ncbi:MAG: NAD(P)/FAD-dependent oxidoreductase [Clostridia bacterium]|nr:NAD(P)/FAD-dependent oxidoreductase [Clostridia bacterium]
MKNVIITGGGPAGMMAAIIAARRGFKVTLVEKNEKLGKKLFITGKGRCNITNAGDTEDLFNSIVTNRKFMFSSFNGFSNYDTLGFFDKLGLQIKIERGNRVFPESDHSSDVIGALNRELKRLSVDVRLNTEVKDIIVNGGKATGVVVKCSGKESTIQADNVIVATGGNSYQSTGSTGDGYRFARKLGHSVTPILPALVPFNVAEDWESDLQGLSLKNVSIVVLDGKQEIYSDFGEMLFTHFGVSGPLILSASSFAARRIKEHPLKLIIDLKPALSQEQLDERILRDFDEEKNKAFKNSLDKLLPKKMIPVIVRLSDIDGNKKVNEITKQERQRLVSLIKGLGLTLTGLRGFNEAIITQGGINVREINPTTMESKLVKNLYFAGEVLDVDALTGGFNLQVAWSTGYAAADHLVM